MRYEAGLLKFRMAGVVGLLSVAALVGCSSVPKSVSSDELAPQTLEPAVESAPAEAIAGDRSDPITATNFPSTTRLVKHAALQLEVDEIDTAIDAVSDILAQYQGELLQLASLDSQANTPPQMSLQLRVPHTNLEVALNRLKELGEPTDQSISAEDVSTQLVDLRARIRNLRKSEESLLEIMERSGSIAEVLEVSRELSTVRESIERNEAQLQNLQNQVAYSTISLTLVEPPVPGSNNSPVGETLSTTWQSASASMQAFSVGLLRLALWLLAFSPYIGILLLSGWLGRRYWQRQRSPKTSAN